MKDAADVLSQSPCAMQLRYLQTLNGIATEQNSTIVFPLPIDLFSFFQRNQPDLTAAGGKPTVQKSDEPSSPNTELLITPTTTNI